MNFTTPAKPVQKLEDLSKEPKVLKPLNNEEQQNTKGGCNCNEKRIKRKTSKSVSYYYIKD